MTERVRARGAVAHVRWARDAIITTEEQKRATATVVVNRCAVKAGTSGAYICDERPQGLSLTPGLGEARPLQVQQQDTALVCTAVTAATRPCSAARARAAVCHAHSHMCALQETRSSK